MKCNGIGKFYYLLNNKGNWQLNVMQNDDRNMPNDPECSLKKLPKVKYKWTPITEEFKSAVKELKLGELVHDNLFGLFDAMSAIEMMDPKMDAGLLCNRGTRKAKSFDHAVAIGIIKLDKISPDDLIGIMDTTLACMVSWLEGHSLAQTVFTNLYLHKPYNVQDKTLRVFSIAIYKLIEIIKHFIHKAHVYEEEDFQPMQYGYLLNPDISEQRIVSMLREVEEFHKRTIIKNPSGATADDEPVETVALYTRIKFIRLFYQTLTMMSQRKEDQSNTGTECQRLFAICLDLLFLVKKTIQLGKQPSGTWCGEIMGFEPLVNQRLLPPTFPRYTKVKPRDEALSYFEGILERLKSVCKIYAVTSYHQALDFLVEFSRRNPCLLTRSILQYLYVGTYTVNQGPSSSNGLKDILKEAAKFFISTPPDVTKAIMTNQQAKTIVDTFLSHCIRPFNGLLQVSGHNRARQREKLAQLLDEFISLQDEAERVDLFLHNMTSKTWTRQNVASYATWILYHTLRVMIMYLLSGFELELYAPHEYPYVYWYLYEYLYGWLVSALTRADSVHMEQELQELQKTKGSKKAKAKHRRKPRPFSKDILYNQALQNMCGGFYKAFVAFRVEGKIIMPKPLFNMEKTRYDHRFLPFKRLITPPPVQYSEFEEVIAISSVEPLTCMHLYISATKHFQQARHLLQAIVPSTPEVVNLLEVCKTNFVVLKLMAGGHKRDSPNLPDYDFSKSKYFPIIKVS